MQTTLLKLINKLWGFLNNFSSFSYLSIPSSFNSILKPSIFPLKTPLLFFTRPHYNDDSLSFSVHRIKPHMLNVIIFNQSNRQNWENERERERIVEKQLCWIRVVAIKIECCIIWFKCKDVFQQNVDAEKIIIDDDITRHYKIFADESAHHNFFPRFRNWKCSFHWRLKFYPRSQPFCKFWVILFTTYAKEWKKGRKKVTRKLWGSHLVSYFSTQGKKTSRHPPNELIKYKNSFLVWDEASSRMCNSKPPETMFE